MKQRIPISDYVDTCHGRALAVVETLERRVGGHGYTYAELIAYLDPPIPALAETRWRNLTVGVRHWCDASDRPLVLSTLAARARLWGQDIRRVDIDTVDHLTGASITRLITTATDLLEAPEPDPFAGLPTD